MTLSRRKIRVISGRDVNIRLLRGAEKLDQLVYARQFRGVALNCFSWWLRNREIYAVAVDEEHNIVVGYSLVIPLTKRGFEMMTSGEHSDRDLRWWHVVSYRRPREVYMYICSAVVHPEYQNGVAVMRLYEAFARQIEWLKTKGIRVVRYAADVVSENGERIARHHGFEMLKVSDHGSKVFVAEASAAAEPWSGRIVGGTSLAGGAAMADKAVISGNAVMSGGKAPDTVAATGT